MYLHHRGSNTYEHLGTFLDEDEGATITFDMKSLGSDYLYIIEDLFHYDACGEINMTARLWHEDNPYIDSEEPCTEEGMAGWLIALITILCITF